MYIEDSVEYCVYEYVLKFIIFDQSTVHGKQYLVSSFVWLKVILKWNNNFLSFVIMSLSFSRYE